MCLFTEPVSSTVPVSKALPDEGILSEWGEDTCSISYTCSSLYVDETHAPVLLSAISDIVDEWEILGALLGLKDSVLKEIKYNWIVGI